MIKEVEEDKDSYDALVLFSGGLDSLLAAKALTEQGLKTLCLHFTSPFFGSAAKVPYWEKIWGLSIKTCDISLEFCSMLIKGPAHGFGSVLNPCVDCKIMILSKAFELLPIYRAKFLATGEVLGQRPMSQRRDTLHLIQNKANVKDILLRPLSALRLEPTPMEQSGLVDRARLYGIHGRGRIAQLELAKKFNIENIPSPAGGCLLTEIENGRRYWQIIKRLRENHSSAENALEDFKLGRLGRQFWLQDGEKAAWLCVGRNREDNKALLEAATPNDVTLKINNCVGPIGLARDGAYWNNETLLQAGRLLAAYSREAQKKESVEISVFGLGKRWSLAVPPQKGAAPQYLPDWREVKKEIQKGSCM